MLSRYWPVVTAGLAVALAAGASPAHADFRVTMHMSSPQLDAMLDKLSPDMKARREKMFNWTVSSSGDKSRVDVLTKSIIVDSGAKISITLDNVARSYYEMSIDTSKGGPALPMPGQAAGQPTEKPKFQVSDTGKTTVVLGHKCHEYLINGTVKGENGQVLTIKDDIQATTDLGSLAHNGTSPFSSFGADEVPGMPLVMDVSMTGGSNPTVNVKLEATEITTDSLPDTIFVIPSGYARVDSPNMSSTPAPKSAPRPGDTPTGTKPGG